ncbi:MAG: hypothetical protein U0231_15575 [Nitrospiraceae bacterium]
MIAQLTGDQHDISAEVGLAFFMKRRVPIGKHPRSTCGPISAIIIDWRSRKRRRSCSNRSVLLIAEAGQQRSRHRRPPSNRSFTALAAVLAGSRGAGAQYHLGEDMPKVIGFDGFRQVVIHPGGFAALAITLHGVGR